MELLSVNGNPIADVLDYRFYICEERLAVECMDGGKHRTFRLRKGEYDDPGMEFDTYLMDKQHRCRNQCIFCFIDQMPAGMRESLYFKDDDSRLSFFFGNYITLTNLNDEDIDRIIKLHISPINVSVHTTNPELRCKMMKNRFAGDSLRFLRRLADAGISINCQLVLCPGINDGEELRRSLTELAELSPAVQSIAAVPVGLTRFREGLYPLRPYGKEEAEAVLSIMEELGDRFLEQLGSRLCYPADEFYIKAGRELPDPDFYEDFSQLENGVGMIALFRQELEEALEEAVLPSCPLKATIATGVDAAPILKNAVDLLQKKWHNLECQVVAVPNRFFGETITVAGLLTAQDFAAALKDLPLGQALLIPDVCLRKEGDRFLDDTTPAQLEQILGVPLYISPAEGAGLIDTLCTAAKNL